jgi:hypothetical protein
MQLERRLKMAKVIKFLVPPRPQNLSELLHQKLPELMREFDACSGNSQVFSPVTLEDGVSIRVYLHIDDTTYVVAIDLSNSPILAIERMSK